MTQTSIAMGISKLTYRFAPYRGKYPSSVPAQLTWKFAVSVPSLTLATCMGFSHVTLLKNLGLSVSCLCSAGHGVRTVY